MVKCRSRAEEAEKHLELLQKKTETMESHYTGELELAKQQLLHETTTSKNMMDKLQMQCEELEQAKQNLNLMQQQMREQQARFQQERDGLTTQLQQQMMDQQARFQQERDGLTNQLCQLKGTRTNFNVYVLF